MNLPTLIEQCRPAYQAWQAVIHDDDKWPDAVNAFTRAQMAFEATTPENLDSYLAKWREVLRYQREIKLELDESSYLEIIGQMLDELQAVGAP